VKGSLPWGQRRGVSPFRWPTFGEKDLFSASQVHHFNGLSTIESDRFLDEHMLACVQCQHDRRVMQIVRGRHVNDIEIVGSDKLFVIAIGSLERHARCEFLGFVFAARTDSRDILAGVGRVPTR
jgi:hypothetical protein